MIKLESPMFALLQLLSYSNKIQNGFWDIFCHFYIAKKKTAADNQILYPLSFESSLEESTPLQSSSLISTITDKHSTATLRDNTVHCHNMPLVKDYLLLQGILLN